VILTISVSSFETKTLIISPIKHSRDELQVPTAPLPNPYVRPIMAAIVATPDNLSSKITPALALSSIGGEPVKQTNPFSSSISSALRWSRKVTANTYATVATLPPRHRVVVLVSTILVVLLIGMSLVSLALLHSSAPIAYAPHSGTLALSDPLHDNSNGYSWPESLEADRSFCQFIHSSYHVGVVRTGTFHYCVAGATSYNDFAFEARMTILKGDQGQYHSNKKRGNDVRYSV